MIRPYGFRTADNIRTYYASQTDLVANYPTDCAAGSSLTVIDEIEHVWLKVYSFDGVYWNLIADFTGGA